jgi:hypothetical protein
MYSMWQSNYTGCACEFLFPQRPLRAPSRDNCVIKTFTKFLRGTQLFSALQKENPIYVFPENKLRGLSPNFHIHVSVSNFHDRSTYIPAAD